MENTWMKSLFDLCTSEICSELSNDIKYAEARKSAYNIEMELRKECSKEQIEKIKALLEEVENASLAESECLFETAFNLGISMVLNALK